MTIEAFPYKLTPTITVGIIRNPTLGRLLKIGSEVLGNDETGQLLACILTAFRQQKRKHYPNSRRYTGRVPRTVWLDPDVKMVLGRLERALKEGREALEENGSP